MTDKLTITNERVDDIPVLLAQLERMQVARLLDECFPTHGNWQGLSFGTVTAVWLTFILSEANHRLSHLEPWAAQRLRMLEACLGQPARALDFSDDRLPVILDHLSEDEAWMGFELALNQHTLRVYDLQPERVRVDSTTAKGYVEVSPDGLFQFGHSKDHRPDLPQIKINISVLDPLGLPMTTTVLSGEKADDPLYVPEIKRVQQSLKCQGVTYVGDSKMAALQTRAYLAASNDYYLCPLPSVQLSDEALAKLLMPVWSGQQVLLPIYRDSPDSESEKMAEGYQYTLWLKAQAEGITIQWPERRMVVRSLKLAQAQEKSLQARVKNAIDKVLALNKRAQGKRLFTQEAELRSVAEQILAKHGVTSLVTLNYTTHINEQPLRCYGKRPATVREDRTVTVMAQVNEAALSESKRSLGWRVYATNQPAEQLSIEQAVLAYRAEYLVEHGIGRLKGKPLSLMPIYLESDQRVIGLLRLLMIGLRVLTLLEFSARRQLQEEGAKLAGIYPGNPKRATERPTTEMMLRAFKGLTLTHITEARRVRTHITPLSEVQQRILQLFGFSPSIYLRLSQHFSKPILNLSEP
jgi:transposase